jgi:hypothetical protein
MFYERGRLAKAMNTSSRCADHTSPEARLPIRVLFLTGVGYRWLVGPAHGSSKKFQHVLQHSQTWRDTLAPKPAAVPAVDARWKTDFLVCCQVGNTSQVQD